MSRTVKPTVTVEEIIEQPDYAAGKLDASTKAATDYTAAALTVAGTLAFIIAASKIIKTAAGPYGGIIDMIQGIFKKGSSDVRQHSDHG